MDRIKLRNMFIITILIIILLFSLILFTFNTIEGMSIPMNTKYSFIDNIII